MRAAVNSLAAEEGRAHNIRVRRGRKGEPEATRDMGRRTVNLKAAAGRQIESAKNLLVLSGVRAAAPWLLHLAACCAFMLIGFRLAREGKILLLGGSETTIQEGRIGVLREGALGGSRQAIQTDLPDPHRPLHRDMLFWDEESSDKQLELETGHEDEKGVRGGSRVGRHGILIRDYPHPDPYQVVLAHELLDLLQERQHRASSIYPPRLLIAITPTFMRTFQTVHMIGLVNSLKRARAPLLWVVIEAPRRTNDTAAILQQSGLGFVHLEYGSEMPEAWEERWLTEVHMRELGLRYVRETRMDGLVLFADDSSVFSPKFFEEAQKVRWFGAAAISILLQTGFTDIFGGGAEENKKKVPLESNQKSLRMPIQSPVCNENGSLSGWHTMLHSPQQVAEGLPHYGEEINIEAERMQMVWGSFVLNSRLLWDDSDHRIRHQFGAGTVPHVDDSSERPSWVRRWEEWADSKAVDRQFNSVGVHQTAAGDLLKRMLVDEMNVEPLGACGKEVLGWWMRAEARGDSRFYSRWQIPELPIVVPAKRTPWPLPKSPPPSALRSVEKTSTLPEDQINNVENGVEGGEKAEKVEKVAADVAADLEGTGKALTVQAEVAKIVDGTTKADAREVLQTLQTIAESVEAAGNKGEDSVREERLSEKGTGEGRRKLLEVVEGDDSSDVDRLLGTMWRDLARETYNNMRKERDKRSHRDSEYWKERRRR